jgi:hypothetical protein
MNINPFSGRMKQPERHRFYSERRSTSQMPTLQDIKSRLNKKPYNKAINELRNIDNIPEPRRKLRLMAQVNEKILE